MRVEFRLWDVNTEQQLAAILDLQPQGYCGTPSFLRILLEKAKETGVDVSSLKKGLVSGEACPPSLRDWMTAHGVDAYTSGHYVTWCELTERSGVDNEAIEAFAEEFGIHRIEEFENAYRGEYDSEEDFAKEHVTGCYMMQYVPDWVVIDWQATWDNELSSSFTYNNGYVFLSDF